MPLLESVSADFDQREEIKRDVSAGGATMRDVQDQPGFSHPAFP
jgi:hypothetical protein